MDGKTLLRLLEARLDESSTSDFIGEAEPWDYLDLAACDFAEQTGIVKSMLVITTVASQQSYFTDPHFLRPYMKNNKKKFFGKYYNGTYYYYPTLKPYEYLFKQNETDEQDVPDYFSIVEPDPLDTPSQVTGTATADGTVSGGQCILNDTAAIFVTGSSKVHARDRIHNTTDGSSGIVLSVTDDTHLVCALFDGTDNDWTTGDAYVIQPALSSKIWFDAPSATSGHTLTLPCISLPPPVYSDYGIWPFSSQDCEGIICGAVFRYKYKDEEPDYGDKFYLHFAEAVRKAKVRKVMRNVQGYQK